MALFRGVPHAGVYCASGQLQGTYVLERSVKTDVKRDAPSSICLAVQALAEVLEHAWPMLLVKLWTKLHAPTLAMLSQLYPVNAHKCFYLCLLITGVFGVLQLACQEVDA